MRLGLSLHHQGLPLEDAMLAQAIRDEIHPDYTMDQPVERYTAGDHAVWRRLERQAQKMLQGLGLRRVPGWAGGLGVDQGGHSAASSG